MNDQSIIDISVRIAAGKTPQWPGSPEIRLEHHKQIACGDHVNDRNLFMNLHTGTHVEGPEHHIKDGKTVDRFALENFVGRCHVADFTALNAVDAKALEQSSIPKDCRRLLLKTRNSSGWGPEFDPRFVALTLDGAEWVARRKLLLIGIDYLSVQPYQGDPNIHLVLMKNDVAILEGLNLNAVTEGEYELFCLPLKLEGVEASPARAILRKTK